MAEADNPRRKKPKPRLEPKNRKDRRHPVANLAARPSATSDNPNSKTYTKSQTYPSTQTRETGANAIFVFPHKTSALGIYIPTRSWLHNAFQWGIGRCRIFFEEPNLPKKMRHRPMPHWNALWKPAERKGVSVGASFSCKITCVREARDRFSKWPRRLE
ncbi:hypothetical protein Bbelb_436710 [Branchiostoma belcheri]|nr:hypothetical protein Bbelb_436710 [Branchiostoma belcheri]